MKFLSIVFISLLLAPSALIYTASAGSSEKWFLMSRHGECAEVKSLQRKIPDIGNIEDPQSFTMFMEGKGHKVIANELKEARGQAFQVGVPEKGLSLMFVKGSMCKVFVRK
jgi:hypothetical protein